MGGRLKEKSVAPCIHLALVNFPPSLLVHDHPCKQTILCPTSLMHERRNLFIYLFIVIYFFKSFFFFLPPSEKNDVRTRRGRWFMFALADRKLVCVCTQHDSPGPRLSPGGPERTTHTDKSHAHKLQTQQQVCVLLYSYINIYITKYLTYYHLGTAPGVFKFFIFNFHAHRLIKTFFKHFKLLNTSNKKS